MADVIVQSGDNGEYVTMVQTRLEELGYAVGGVDGDYGRRTTEAIQAFQAAYALPITGSVDDITWAALFSSSSEQPGAVDPTGGATAGALIDIALHQVNDRYVFGANADETNPDEDEFDCAELISWSLAQLGVSFPDYSVHQIDAVALAGLEISVSAAAGVRGALLFREAGHNGSKYNHVALSLGTGDDTIEAMSGKYGVCVGTVGQRFTRGGYIPGVVY